MEGYMDEAMDIDEGSKEIVAFHQYVNIISNYNR